MQSCTVPAHMIMIIYGITRDAGRPADRRDASYDWSHTWDDGAVAEPLLATDIRPDDSCHAGCGSSVGDTGCTTLCGADCTLALKHEGPHVCAACVRQAFVRELPSSFADGAGRPDTDRPPIRARGASQGGRHPSSSLTPLQNCQLLRRSGLGASGGTTAQVSWWFCSRPFRGGAR